MPDPRDTTVVHAQVLSGEKSVPEKVERRMMTVLDDVTIAASRGELVEAIEALYAAHGVWEEWLAEEATP